MEGWHLADQEWALWMGAADNLNSEATTHFVIHDSNSLQPRPMVGKMPTIHGSSGFARRGFASL